MFKKLLIVVIIVTMVRLGYRYISRKHLVTKLNATVTTATNTANNTANNIVNNAENTVNTVKDTINPEELLDKAKNKVINLISGNTIEE